MKIFSIFHGFMDLLIKNTERNPSQIGIFGFLLSINYPLFYFLWSVLTPDNYESFSLRFVATALCVPLMLYKKWPRCLEKFLPIYWHGSVIFCLPFFFTFMTLKNHLNFLWLMNDVTMFFIVLLLFDVLDAFFVLVSGLLLAIGVYYSFGFYSPFGMSKFLFNNSQLIGIAATFMAAIIIGGLFSINNRRQEEMRISTIRAAGASIAHELRTPLFAIGSLITGLKRLLPRLIATYQVARQQHLDVPNISNSQIEVLSDSADDIDTMVKSGLVFIDMFNKKVNMLRVPREDFTTHSIASCVEEALKLYPFKLDELDKIHWQSGVDFQFWGDDKMYVECVV